MIYTFASDDNRKIGSVSVATPARTREGELGEINTGDGNKPTAEQVHSALGDLNGRRDGQLALCLHSLKGCFNQRPDLCVGG